MSDEAPLPIPKSSLAARLLRPKVAIPATLVLLLLSPWLIRGYHLMGVPDIGEPFDVEARLAVVVPDDENAFTDFHQAAALYIQPSKEVSRIRDEVNEHGWAWATPELEQFLHDNEAALLAWRRGAEKSRAQCIVAREAWMGTSLESVVELREFVRATLVIGRKLESEGKPLTAGEWYRTAIRVSRLCGQNGTVIERAVGILLFTTIAERIPSWSTNPSLHSAQLLEALAQLQSDWALTESPSTNLEIDHILMMNLIFRVENHIDELKWSDLIESASDNQFVWYIRGEPELTRRLLKFHNRNQLMFCNRSAWRRPALEGPSWLAMLYDDPDGLRIGEEHWSIVAFFDAAMSSDLFESIVSMPHYNSHQLRSQLDGEDVQYACLQVVLAGQAFHRDHERFPTTLDELVPNYLTEIPVDPFDGQPIKYRLDPVGAVVYSVYLNKLNDGGVFFEYDQIVPGAGRIKPDDFGLRLLTPGAQPLVAPKPRGMETDEDWEVDP